MSTRIQPPWSGLRVCMLLVSMLLVSTLMKSQSLDQRQGAASVHSIDSFDTTQVIELRRYTVRDGERQHFAQYFESFFPEALQQLGVWVAGDFLERDTPAHFTWLRVFHSMDDRAKGNAQLYYGPVWKEHKALMNGLMLDSDNVLLLRPVDAASTVPILPAVDVVHEPSAKGVVVAQIFAIKPGATDTFLQQARPLFAGYAGNGVRSVALLTTLDAANNFPQLPIRSDGPFVVWLGVARDDAALQELLPKLKKYAEAGLGESVRSNPEIVVMDPGARSRLRWLPEAN